MQDETLYIYSLPLDPSLPLLIRDDLRLPELPQESLVARAERRG